MHVYKFRVASVLWCECQGLFCLHACTLTGLLCLKLSLRVLVCCRYSGVFPSLNMAVKRREQALQDYKRLQSKVEKYEEKEKTGPVMVKLHQVPQSLKHAPVHASVHSSAPSIRRGAEFTCSYMLHIL